MAAPAVIGIIAFLVGAGGAPTIAGLTAKDVVIEGVRANLPALCALTDPLADATDNPKSHVSVSVVAAADTICAAAAPGAPIKDAATILKAIEAVVQANRALDASSKAAP